VTALRCTCGELVEADRALSTHQFDGESGVLELRNCPSCRSTVSRPVDVRRLRCACPGCCAARAARRIQTAPSVGEEFRRLRLAHRMKGPVHDPA
jgi:hypothetical protein